MGDTLELDPFSTSSLGYFIGERMVLFFDVVQDSTCDGQRIVTSMPECDLANLANDGHRDEGRKDCGDRWD